jgi:hypothetical protein
VGKGRLRVGARGGGLSLGGHFDAIGVVSDLHALKANEAGCGASCGRLCRVRSAETTAAGLVCERFGHGFERSSDGGSQVMRSAALVGHVGLLSPQRFSAVADPREIVRRSRVEGEANDRRAAMDRANISTEHQPKGSGRNPSDTLDKPDMKTRKVGERTDASPGNASTADVVDEKGRPLNGDGTTA